MNHNVPDKMRKTNVILKLSLMKGRSLRGGNYGLVDHSVFSGDNNLRAIMNPETCLWKFSYDKGILPPGLRGQLFTGFRPLMDHASKYMKQRGIEITEVID